MGKLRSKKKVSKKKAPVKKAPVKKDPVKKAPVKKDPVKKDGPLTRQPGTIGHLIIEELKARKTNEEILTKVTKKFTDCNTTIASISWYRNRLRKNDNKIPTNRELTAKNPKKPAKK